MILVYEFNRVFNAVQNNLSLLSGYHLYMHYALKKTDKGGLGLSMRYASQGWKHLPPDSRDFWCQKTESVVTAKMQRQSKRRSTEHKLTGYNLYMRETKQSLPLAAQNWKLLSEQQKAEWKNKANC